MFAHIRETPLEDLPGSKHMLRLVHVSSDLSFWEEDASKKEYLRGTWCFSFNVLRGAYSLKQGCTATPSPRPKLWALYKGDAVPDLTPLLISIPVRASHD